MENSFLQKQQADEGLSIGDKLKKQEQDLNQAVILLTRFLGIAVERNADRDLQNEINDFLAEAGEMLETVRGGQLVSFEEIKFLMVTKPADLDARLRRFEGVV